MFLIILVLSDTNINLVLIDIIIDDFKVTVIIIIIIILIVVLSSWIMFFNPIVNILNITLSLILIHFFLLTLSPDPLHHFVLLLLLILVVLLYHCIIIVTPFYIVLVLRTLFIIRKQILYLFCRGPQFFQILIIFIDRELLNQLLLIHPRFINYYHLNTQYQYT